MKNKILIKKVENCLSYNGEKVICDFDKLDKEHQKLVDRFSIKENAENIINDESILIYENKENMNLKYCGLDNSIKVDNELETYFNRKIGLLNVYLEDSSVMTTMPSECIVKLV